MKERCEYIKAQLEIVVMEDMDIITTSGVTDPEGNYDSGAWT